MGCLSSKELPKPKAGVAPPPIALPTPSQAKKNVELKIISLAKAIKVLVSPHGDSKVKTPDALTEAKIMKNFKEIIELAKKSTSLDGSCLNEVLMCCNAMRLNNAPLAAKFAFLSQTAKKLVEERTTDTDDADSPTDSSSSKADKEIHALHKATPATLVSQIPKTSSNRDTRLSGLDGLPPLKDFSKPTYFDSSQHSADFGFFDMSVHDRTGMPEWTGVTPQTADLPAPPLKLQYSVSQLDVSRAAQ